MWSALAALLGLLTLLAGYYVRKSGKQTKNAKILKSINKELERARRARVKGKAHWAHLSRARRKRILALLREDRMVTKRFKDPRS